MKSDAPHPVAKFDIPSSVSCCLNVSSLTVQTEALVPRTAERAYIELVQLAFETTHLRTLCESSADAIHELGQDVAAALRDRLADLDSAVSIEDILLGRPQAFDTGDLVIELTPACRLLCRANHPNNPKIPLDATAWSKVSRVKIVDIVKS